MTDRSRRDFLTLGSLTLGAFGLTGCDHGRPNENENSSRSGGKLKPAHGDPEKEANRVLNPTEKTKNNKNLPFGVDIEKWKQTLSNRRTKNAGSLLAARADGQEKLATQE